MGLWTLDFGRDLGRGDLGNGTLDFGRWTLAEAEDFGLWTSDGTLDFGHWTLLKHHAQFQRARLGIGKPP